MIVLKKSHPKFQYFCWKLCDPDACDFKQVDGEWIWSCDNQLTHTRRILEEMGDIDVEATMKYFKENGGYCDCEIIWNVR